MEVTTPRWNRGFFPFLNITESTNPGLYFALKLREVVRNGVQGIISERRLTTTSLPSNERVEKEMPGFFDESHQSQIYKILSKAGRESEFVDISSILPGKVRLPRLESLDYSYVAPCTMMRRQYMSLGKRKKILNPHLYISLSPKTLDYRRKSRMRCQPRGPRRLASFMSFNGVLT